MEFRVTCSGCSKRYRVNEKLVGKFLKCKRCDTYLEIRDPGAEPEENLTEAQIVESPPGANQPTAGTTLPGSPVTGTPVTGVPGTGVPGTGVPGTGETAAPVGSPSIGYDPLATNPPLPLQPQPPLAPPMAVPSAGTAGGQGVPMAGVPVAGNAWNAAGAQARQGVATAKPNTVGPFGVQEIICLIFGVLILLGGLVFLLLQNFGVVNYGRIGAIIGLIVGLVGTALLTKGLQAFKWVSLGGGLASAGLIFTLFAFLFIPSSDSDDDTGTSGSSGINLASVSAWMKNYPGWKAMGTNLRGGGTGTVGNRASDVWPDEEMSDIGLTAKFPTSERIKRETGKQELDGETIDVSIYKHSFSTARGACLLAIRYFEAPNSEYTTERILTDIEEALKKQVTALEYQSKDVTVDRNPGKEVSYRTKSNGRDIRIHQRIIVRDTSVYLIFASGPVSLVPGSESTKFLRSIRFDKNWRPSGRLADAEEGASDALDPFSFGGDNSGDNAAGSPNSAGAPEYFQVVPNEKIRESKISMRRRKLEAEMDEVLGMKARLGFPAAYLTQSAGDERSNRAYYADPGKRPVTAIDVSIAQRGGEKAIRLISPIYNRSVTDHNTIVAKRGYALGAIYVNVQERVPGNLHVTGLQFVFMKVTDKGLITSDSYSSDWVGQAPTSGRGVSIETDGRPVYGFWVRSGLTLSAIGLIVEAEYNP